MKLALSKTGRFLSKAEILGVGGLFPPFMQTSGWRKSCDPADQL